MPSRPCWPHCPADATNVRASTPAPHDTRTPITFPEFTRSRVEMSLDRLAGAIVARSYPGQAMPPQDALVTEFGVSRTVLREAINRLLARNMVEVRPKSGTRIVDEHDWRIVDRNVVDWRFERVARLASAMDSPFLQDLAIIRQLVEPFAAAQAAVHASDFVRQTIQWACRHASPPPCGNSVNSTKAPGAICTSRCSQHAKTRSCGR
ncbi:Transcriptional regulator, GntR family [Candidatus Burkholderia pumila]|uniref:Transcriptional regulator, GntR family n=1 Tax=Candidatus Burkholderia pumila TaxID=1090375 RepID=A0ABR5HPK1_9BURK|nr:Transcriptional regulator, GntR family [Candidatus Burkholderia pumila]